MMIKIKFSLVITIICLVSVKLLGQSRDIALPAPETQGGMSLMQALQNRSSCRSFSEKNLDLQVLSNLLWAAYGINRPESGKRTAPSSHNIQEFSIYVFLADGVYLYDAKSNTLILIIEGDYHKYAGTQDYVQDAAVNLVYVADYSKMTKIEKQEDKDMTASIDAGFICQNVYLYCASVDLGCVVRASINKPELAELLKLTDNLKIIIAQSVGYKK